MPDNYIIEMVCDWWAFSWSKGDLREIYKWYKKNRGNMLLNEETETRLNEILDAMKEIIDNDFYRKTN